MFELRVIQLLWRIFPFLVVYRCAPFLWFNVVAYSIGQWKAEEAGTVWCGLRVAWSWRIAGGGRDDLLSVGRGDAGGGLFGCLREGPSMRSSGLGGPSSPAVQAWC